jgi:hypothetical protein
MKLVLYVIVLLFPFFAIAQEMVVMNDKNVVLRDLDEFSGIHIKGPFKVYYSQGSKYAVGVSASTEGARDKIVTRVSAGILHVELEGTNFGWWGKNPEFKVYVSSPEIKNIQASGAVNFLVTDMIKADALNMRFTGASDFSGKLQCKSVILSFTGASDVEVMGTSEKLVAELTGASKFSGAAFKVIDAELKATGASSIKISVTGTLGAIATGASNIVYYGSPKSLSTKASGASSVKKGN